MIYGEQFPAPNPMHQPEVIKAFSGYDVGPFPEEVRTGDLHNSVRQVLTRGNIEVLSSSFRAKSPASIRNKVGRSGWPLFDIYGLRIMVAEDDISRSIALINEAFPTPPLIEFGDRLIRTVRKDGNNRSDPRYDILRMNIVFDRTKMAEVQLLHPGQVEIEEETRGGYEAKKVDYKLSETPQLRKWISPIERIKELWVPERRAFISVAENGEDRSVCPLPSAFDSFAVRLEARKNFGDKTYNKGLSYDDYLAGAAKHNLSLLILLGNLESEI